MIMGNYCCASSSAVWAGDDWGSVVPPPEQPPEKEALLVDCGGESSSTVGNTGEQVRIRISKKQLEELLRKVDGSGAQRKKMRAQQVLQRLIDESDHFEVHHNGAWRPALQSIPEVN